MSLHVRQPSGPIHQQQVRRQPGLQLLQVQPGEERGEAANLQPDLAGGAAALQSPAPAQRGRPG